MAERHLANNTRTHNIRTWVLIKKIVVSAVELWQMTPFSLQTHRSCEKSIPCMTFMTFYSHTISTLKEFAIYFFCRHRRCRCSFLSLPLSRSLEAHLHQIETVQISEYKVVQCFGSAPMKTFCSQLGLTEIINNQNGSINHFFSTIFFLFSFALTILSSWGCEQLRLWSCVCVCAACAVINNKLTNASLLKRCKNCQ